ncbi:MAG: hypothetical protein LC128_08335 [Chitinophagales bacterium]|nr:hypothetical protein [Chitinophagales bacterium]
MKKQTEQRSLDSLKDEYSEVNQNFRHFSSLRFNIFTVFFAVQAGIAAVAFSEGKFIPNAPVAAKVGGILVTFFFWIYQERVVLLIGHFMKVATELEQQLGYTQISKRPPAKFPSLDINTITRLFFPILFAFWVYTLFW